VFTRRVGGEARGVHREPQQGGGKRQPLGGTGFGGKSKGQKRTAKGKTRVGPGGSGGRGKIGT